MGKLITYARIVVGLSIAVGALAVGLGMWALSVQLVNSYVGSISDSVVMVGVGAGLIVMGLFVADILVKEYDD